MHAFQNKLIITSDFTDSLHLDSFTLSSSGESQDACIICIDTSGNVNWLKRLGGTGYENWICSTVSDTSGALYIYGRSDTVITFGSVNIQPNKWYIVKYDINGNISWAKQSNDFYTGLNFDDGKLITMIADTVNGDRIMEMFDINGNSLQVYHAKAIHTYDIKYISNGHYILTGGFGTNSPLGPLAPSISGCYLYCNGLDLFIMELNDSIVTLNVSENINTQKLIIYPNPSNGIFTIKHKEVHSSICVYNIYGQLLLTKQDNSPSIQIDLNSQPKGVYILEMITDKGKEVIKIVLN